MTAPHTMPCDLCAVMCREGRHSLRGCAVSIQSAPIALDFSLCFLYDQLLAHLSAEERCKCASENNQVYSYPHMHVVVLQILSFSACEKLKKKKSEGRKKPFSHPHFRLHSEELVYYIWSILYG